LDSIVLNLYYGDTLSHLGFNSVIEARGLRSLKEYKEEISMSIVRYDPFRDLRSLQEEVNRLFSTTLSRSFDDEGVRRASGSPTVDIYENKDQIVLEAELPGMRQEDFNLPIANNYITLRGELSI